MRPALATPPSCPVPFIRRGQESSFGAYACLTREQHLLVLLPVRSPKTPSQGAGRAHLGTASVAMLPSHPVNIIWDTRQGDPDQPLRRPACHARQAFKTSLEIRFAGRKLNPQGSRASAERREEGDGLDGLSPAKRL